MNKKIEKLLQERVKLLQQIRRREDVEQCYKRIEEIDKQVARYERDNQ